MRYKKRQSLLHDLEQGPGDGGSCDDPGPGESEKQMMTIKDIVVKDMDDIRALMRDLKSLYRAHLKPSFSVDEGNDMEQQIKSLTFEIKELFRLCNEDVRQVGLLEQGLPADRRKLSGNMQRRLATELTKLSQDFRLQQKLHLQDLEKRKKLGDTFLPQILEEDPDEEKMRQLEHQMVVQGLSDEQIAEILLHEDILREREQGIQGIMESITEIHEMFKDMSDLVIEQGSMFDRIDANIEHTVQETKMGVEELRKAEEYQRRSRLDYCILLLLCVCGLFVLLIIVQKI